VIMTMNMVIMMIKRMVRLDVLLILLTTNTTYLHSRL
jgi:hypothetical protein